MSVPYGQPPPAQQPEPPSRPDSGVDLGKAFAIIAGCLGGVIYIVSFADDVGGYLRAGLLGIMLLGGGLLAAASVLPKAPATLVPATVLVVTATLFLFIDVVKNPVFVPVFLPGVGPVTTPAAAVVALILAAAESGACVVALLAETSLLKSPPRPSPYQSWGPQQPIGYPPPQPSTDQYRQTGQFGQQGQYGLPGQYGQSGGSYGGQPWHQGQPYGQPGTPPGDFGSPGRD